MKSEQSVSSRRLRLFRGIFVGAVVGAILSVGAIALAQGFGNSKVNGNRID